MPRMYFDVDLKMYPRVIDQEPIRYRGWKVTFDSWRPRTSLWVGERFSVTVCAGSQELLKRIIDQKIKDDKEWRIVGTLPRQNA